MAIKSEMAAHMRYYRDRVRWEGEKIKYQEYLELACLVFLWSQGHVGIKNQDFLLDITSTPRVVRMFRHILGGGKLETEDL